MVRRAIRTPDYIARQVAAEKAKKCMQCFSAPRTKRRRANGRAYRLCDGCLAIALGETKEQE